MISEGEVHTVLSTCLTLQLKQNKHNICCRSGTVTQDYETEINSSFINAGSQINCGF
jgi:dUTPase